MIEYITIIFLILGSTNCLLPLIFPSVPQNPLPPDVIIHETEACGNSTLLLECPPQHQIYVLNANYGRYTASVCPSNDPSLDTNVCMSDPGTTAIVKKRCDERDYCAVPVTDAVLGEICPTTYKYGKVIYECIRYSRGCQGSSVMLSCPSGKIISIFDANYGRTLPGSEACPAANSNNTECLSGNAVAISQSICDGLSTCIVPASTDIFGDTCEGTFKYLEIKYMCQ